MDLTRFYEPTVLTADNINDQAAVKRFLLDQFGEARSSVVDSYVNTLGLFPGNQSLADMYVNSGLASYDVDWRNVTSGDWTSLKDQLVKEYGQEVSDYITSYAKGAALEFKDEYGKTLSESEYFKHANDPEVKAALELLYKSGGDYNKLKDAAWDEAKSRLYAKGKEYAGQALAYTYSQAAQTESYQRAKAWYDAEGSKYSAVVDTAVATYYASRQKSMMAKAAYAGAAAACTYYGQSASTCTQALSAVVAYSRGQISQAEFDRAAGRIVGAAAAVTACAACGAAIAAPLCGYIGGILGGEAAYYSRELRDYLEGTVLSQIPGVNSIVDLANTLERGVLKVVKEFVSDVADVLGL